jgi:uncharacterized membrane protein YcaP (DUF421 family)
MLADLWKTALTALLSIAALFLTAKLSGHRLISEMDFFSYLMSITVGSVAAELATELESPWKPLVAMAVYTAVTVGSGLLTAKLPRSRRFVNGSPTILLHRGRLYRDNLKRARLDLSDFLMMCRQAGYFDLSTVQTAVFEFNGRISFLPAAANRPAQPADLGIVPTEARFSTEIIMDGRILDGNLKRLGFDRRWLDKRLAEQGFSSPKRVFLGLWDGAGNCTLYTDSDPAEG